MMVCRTYTGVREARFRQGARTLPTSIRLASKEQAMGFFGGGFLVGTDRWSLPAHRIADDVNRRRRFARLLPLW